MGKSSKDKRDAYYRLAKEQGWRARSAFKLLQLDEEFNLFENVTRVVDLCAAPGSWSQVLSRVLIKGESLGRSAWEDQQAKDKLALIQPPASQTTASQGSHSGISERTKSQQRERKPRKDVKIVAIDLQPMSPLEGITTVRADITHPSTIPLLLKALDPEIYADPSVSPSTTQASHPVDLVISDGAPDVTGLHDLDTYIQSQLLWSALNLALCVLKRGGTFVAKIFRAKDVDLLYAQLRICFESVTIAKPRSSRASSVEAFIVCLGFAPPEGFTASLENPLGAQGGLRGEKIGGRDGAVRRRVDDGHTILDFGEDEEEEDDQEGDAERQARWIAPFMACGDLSAYDADASYHLPKDRVSLDPVQPPTAPPYKRALEMRKAAGGAYGKTSLGKASPASTYPVE